MRYLYFAFAGLLSFIVPSVPAWALPTTTLTNFTVQCPGPTITLTMNGPGAGAFLSPTGSGAHIHFDGAVTAQLFWPPGTTSTNNPATFAIPSSVAPGSHTLNVTYANDMQNPDRTYTITVPNCGGGGTAKKGMTWVHLISNPVHGTVTVGCNGSASILTDRCNALTGDTVCSASKPMLCIYGGKTSPSAPGLFPKPPSVVGTDQYNRWSGGVVATTAPVVGSSFTSRLQADQKCQADFGAGWRMAEFHDGWGWNFQAYGGTSGAPNVGPAERFWVFINDKPANCFP